MLPQAAIPKNVIYSFAYVADDRDSQGIGPADNGMYLTLPWAEGLHINSQGIVVSSGPAETTETAESTETPATADEAARGGCGATLSAASMAWRIPLGGACRLLRKKKDEI